MHAHPTHNCVHASQEYILRSARDGLRACLLALRGMVLDGKVRPITPHVNYIRTYREMCVLNNIVFFNLDVKAALNFVWFEI
jgi:hypothetical protein